MSAVPAEFDRLRLVGGCAPQFSTGTVPVQYSLQYGWAVLYCTVVREPGNGSEEPVRALLGAAAAAAAGGAATG